MVMYNSSMILDEIRDKNGQNMFDRQLKMKQPFHLNALVQTLKHKWFFTAYHIIINTLYLIRLLTFSFCDVRIYPFVT